MVLTKDIVVFVSIRALDFPRRDFSGNGHTELSVFLSKTKRQQFSVFFILMAYRNDVDDKICETLFPLEF